jgi:hypothetical protein
MNNSTPELDTETLAAAIRAFEVANPGLRTFVLVYGVAYPQLYRELQRWFGLEMAHYRLSLMFDAHCQESGGQYGPFLVRIAPGAPKPSGLLTRLARHCVDDFRAVSFLFSSLPFADLAARLRERLDVKGEDRSEWQMHFFDTRSLPVLDSALSVEQRREYFCVVKEWWYLDRYGQQQKVIGESATADSYSGPLRLDDKQAAAFDAAAVPDSVLYSLSLTDGNPCDEPQPSDSNDQRGVVRLFPRCRARSCLCSSPCRRMQATR